MKKFEKWALSLLSNEKEAFDVVEVCILREKILVVIHIYTSRQKIKKFIFQSPQLMIFPKIVNNYNKKSVEDQLKIFKNQTTDSKLNTFANC